MVDPNDEEVMADENEDEFAGGCEGRGLDVGEGRCVCVCEGGGVLESEWVWGEDGVNDGWRGDSGVRVG